MKIKYVGLKLDGETAFSQTSGVPMWMPGDAFEVNDAVAVKMLNHPDVFAVDVEPDKDSDVVEIDAPLLALSLDELKAKAKEMGLTVHHKAGASTLIRAIQGAGQ